MHTIDAQNQGSSHLPMYYGKLKAYGDLLSKIYIFARMKSSQKQELVNLY